MTFEDFCTQHNIIVSFVDLPSSNRGLCVYLDGTFEVLVNNNFSSPMQRQTLIHELVHIFKDHFFLESASPEQCEIEVTKFLHESNFLDFAQNDFY